MNQYTKSQLFAHVQGKLRYISIIMQHNSTMQLLAIGLSVIPWDAKGLTENHKTLH